MAHLQMICLRKKNMFSIVVLNCQRVSHFFLDVILHVNSMFGDVPKLFIITSPKCQLFIVFFLTGAFHAGLLDGLLGVAEIITNNYY